jgi:hypothetical protein
VTGDSVVLSDGAHTIACVAVDAAGNETTSDAEFRVDQTPPTVEATLTPSASGTGWWNAATGAPTVMFTCDDTGSGIASCPAASTLGEGTDQAATGTATDVAGNSTTATATGIDVDLTAPLDLGFTGTALVDGGTYPYLFVPVGPSGCVAEDAGSGIATCHVSGYSDVVGSHVLSGVASDAAGNTTTVTLAYEVLPWTLIGFARPVDMDELNMVKAGGSVPLKFDAYAGGIKLNSADVVAGIEQQRISCTSDALLGTPAPVSPSRAGRPNEDAGGQPSTRWDAPDEPGTCWLVTLRTLDGSSLSAAFRLR